ncbi:MAG: zinc ribbon domain-containing protein [Acidobacteria bacterium]|nr:zinc ribbon domain-containing protein [Acidobacteriota bacterium]
MSSGTSTDHGHIRPDSPESAAQPGMQPWQFFVLAGLGCATAVTFMARAQGLTVVLLLSLLMATTVLVAIAAFRAIRPLVSEQDDRSAVIGQRTRAALEQEKANTLRTIKELEFDRAMGKMSEEDFREMSSRLRARAARLIKQLDAGTGYRPRIEQDLARRLGERAEAKPSRAARACAQCSTANDPDARFCKNCGGRLA